jgi:hypothetical protein
MAFARRFEVEGVLVGATPQRFQTQPPSFEVTVDVGFLESEDAEVEVEIMEAAFEEVGGKVATTFVVLRMGLLVRGVRVMLSRPRRS